MNKSLRAFTMLLYLGLQMLMQMSCLSVGVLIKMAKQLFFFLRRSFTLVTQAGVQMARSRLTPTSASWVQAILLPQPPEQLGLQARATMPS